MKNKRVLIVWSELPEKVAFVPITTSEETMEQLRSYNGHYINSCGTPEELQAEMNDFFYPGHGYFKFKDFEKEGPLEEDFDLIIQCGFIL